MAKYRLDFRLFSTHLLTVQTSIKHFSDCLICYSVYLQSETGENVNDIDVAYAP